MECLSLPLWSQGRSSREIWPTNPVQFKHKLMLGNSWNMHECFRRLGRIRVASTCRVQMALTLMPWEQYGMRRPSVYLVVFERDSLSCSSLESPSHDTRGNSLAVNSISLGGFSVTDFYKTFAVCSTHRGSISPSGAKIGRFY